jgi:hypothetical protein
MMKTVPETYVFTWKKNQYSWILLLLLSALTMSLFAGLFWLKYWDLVKLGDYKKIAPQSLIPLAALPLGFAFHFAMQKFFRSARLIVDSSGVRLEQLPGQGPAIMKFLERKILWADVKSVTYLSSFELIHLRSTPTMQPMSIRVKEWQLQKPDITLNARNAEPDLIKLFRELEVFESFSKDNSFDAATFDLMKHPATKKLLLLNGGLVIYSFLDSMLQHEGYAFFKPGPHELAAMSAAAIVAGLLLKARVRDYIPSGIVAGLAMMAAITFGVASYVGGVRINQLAGGPLLEAKYHRDEKCLKLLPEDKSLPVVEYTEMTTDYWCSRGIDEVQTVRVRKGLFNSYQFDLREQTKAIRDYKQKS